jgi:ATP-binding cassette subfamily F protein uup
MAAPLLLLQDIHLTFGSTPLLAGAELSVGAGERLSLVGRNGTGKSTLLRIAAGLVEPDSGRRFLQPGTTARYLAQEPDLSGFATTEGYVAAGLGPGDDPHRARLLLEQLDLTGKEDPSAYPAAKAAAPHWRGPWPPTRTSCSSTSRPTISTSSPSRHWRRRSVPPVQRS